MLYPAVLLIESGEFITCSTTGQQYEIAQACQAEGIKCALREYPHHKNSPKYEDYQDLRKFIKMFSKHS